MPDFIIIGSDTLLLREFPLEKLKIKLKPFGAKKSNAPHTACWRGYQATWFLSNDSLFLTDISNCSGDSSKTTNILNLFRQNKLESYIVNDRVFAGWYTAKLYLDSYVYNDKKDTKPFIRIYHSDYDKGKTIIRVNKGKFNKTAMLLKIN